jgi:hypothetical protein
VLLEFVLPSQQFHCIGQLTIIYIYISLRCADVAMASQCR